MIKGIDVILYTKTQTGTDGFNAPIFQEIPETVGNVLVMPASSEDIVSELSLSGKHLVYNLCIPKTDVHVWTDRTVEFFGEKWRTFGYPEEWISDMVPLLWNRRIKVERYG